MSNKKTINVQHSKLTGFTLIEIVIALAILVIGLIGVLALFPTGMVASKRAGDLNMATIAAGEVLANIRKIGIGALPKGWTLISYWPGGRIGNTAYGFLIQRPAGFPAGLYKVTIRIYTADPVGDYDVTFPDGRRRRAFIDDFVTYVAQR
jgi:prepilin-type N-terminal cleavage/methylation domain-containing protein